MNLIYYTYLDKVQRVGMKDTTVTKIIAENHVIDNFIVYLCRQEFSVTLSE